MSRTFGPCAWRYRELPALPFRAGERELSWGSHETHVAADGFVTRVWRRFSQRTADSVSSRGMDPLRVTSRHGLLSATTSSPATDLGVSEGDFGAAESPIGVHGAVRLIGGADPTRPNTHQCAGHFGRCAARPRPRPFWAVCSTAETTPLLGGVQTAETTPLLGEVQQQVIAPCLRSEPFTLFCPRARILGAAPRRPLTRS